MAGQFLSALEWRSHEARVRGVLFHRGHALDAVVWVHRDSELERRRNWIFVQPFAVVYVCDDDPDDSGEFVVLQVAWDEESSQVIVYYFDKAAAEADGKSRDDLLRDLQHRSVLYSNVHDVVEWINNRK